MSRCFSIVQFVFIGDSRFIFLEVFFLGDDTFQPRVLSLVRNPSQEGASVIFLRQLLAPTGVLSNYLIAILLETRIGSSQTDSAACNDARNVKSLATRL